MTTIVEKLNELLISIGVSESTAGILDKTIVLLLIIALAFLIQKICKRIVLSFFEKVTKRTKATWDDVIFDPKVIGKLTALIAPIIIYILAPTVFKAGTVALDFTQRICVAYIILMFIRFLSSLLNAFYVIYNSKEKYRDRPLRGVIQTIQVVLYFIGGIVIVSILIKQSPLGILAGLGAFAAVLMLVFQDSILGFVSGIQLSANNMVRVGDWIEMPKYGVDGDVLEITLNTVKVQNFDKTIVTIPPTLLIKDSFKNWRGMEEAGGRRVKRSVFIDMTSVTFCSDEMLQRYHKIQILNDYLNQKEKILTEYNKENNIDNSVVVNGRRQTNLGVFRAYLEYYLKNHPSVNHGMTCMVRQLQPGDAGIPLELYFFTATTKWIDYEGIQADIFDHVLAVIPYFDLKVFQNPTGSDFKILGLHKN